jgi:hypothetical protein
MYRKPRFTLFNLFKILSIILLAILFIVAIVHCIQYQFKVYQKKHGTHMTWTDFMLDSERK